MDPDTQVNRGVRAFQRTKSPAEALTAAFTGEGGREERAREDFEFYFENTVRDEITDEYVNLAEHHRKIIRDILDDDEILIAMVQLSRGAGKSTLLNAWATWMGARKPNIRIIIASGTDGQSTAQMRGIEAQARNEDHVAAFGDLMPTQKERNDYGYVWNIHEKKFVDRSKGIRPMGRFPTFFATSVGTDLAGKRSDIIIADDLIGEKVAYSPKSNEHAMEWFNQTLKHTRGDPNTAKIIIIGTPYAAGDLYDQLYSEMKDQPWFRFYKVTAFLEDERGERVIDPDTGLPISYWPERFPPETLLRIESENHWTFQSQFMLKKFDLTKAALKQEWLQIALIMPESMREIPDVTGLKVYMGIDPAGMKPTEKGDYYTVAVVGVDQEENKAYVLDLVLTRGDKETTMDMVADLIRSWRPEMIHVETDGQHAHFYYLESEMQKRFENEPSIRVNLDPVSTENTQKIIRIKEMSNYFINESVMLAGYYDRETGIPRHLPALDPFVDQWIVFPTGAHDDALDAVDIALHSFYSHNAPVTESVRPGSERPPDPTPEEREDLITQRANQIRAQAKLMGISPIDVVMGRTRGRGMVTERPGRMLR